MWKWILGAVGAYLAYASWFWRTGRYWEYNIAENKWYLRKNWR